jgi:hypothetical protein
VPRVAVQVRGEHWVRLNIVRFVPGEVGKIQRSSRHTPRLDQWELVWWKKAKQSGESGGFLGVLLACWW